jgi:uncharacterized protein (DUF2267 family)
MSTTGLRAFDSTVEKTHIWLNELLEDLGWGEDRQKAYAVLRAALHALRDRLTVDQAAHLGAQLPMLIRGFYYEGWVPSDKPLRQRSKEEFLENVQRDIADPSIDVEEATRAVFRLLDRRISEGEIGTIRNSMPSAVKQLWPGHR